MTSVRVARMGIEIKSEFPFGECFTKFTKFAGFIARPDSLRSCSYFC